MSLYEQANLKFITCVQKLEIIRIFFHGDDNDDDDDDDYYYLTFLIIFHFICIGNHIISSAILNK